VLRHLPGAGRNRSGEVHNVHQMPLLVGDYAVVGFGVADSRSHNGRPTARFEVKVDTEYLRSAAGAVRGHHIIVLSHEPPPAGAVDREHRSNQRRGSDAPRFVLKGKDLPLWIAGSASFGGGETQRLGRSLVVNTASPSDPRLPGRVGLIELRDGKVCRV